MIPYSIPQSLKYVTFPLEVSDVLREAAQYYSESDDKHNVWNNVALILERAADQIDNLL